MNLPCLIAQRLFDIGVRMRDEDDYGMLLDKRINESDRDEIGQMVLMHGKSIELELNTDQIQAMGLIDAARHVAWIHAQQHLTEAVDEELWIYQNERARSRYEDEQIDHIKENRSAA